MTKGIYSKTPRSFDSVIGFGSRYEPKTGGRKRGSLNKRTITQQQQIKTVVQAAKEAGLTPLQYMLAVMRDPATPSQRRDDMAKACAPYVHPKLAAVDPETGKPAQEQGQVNIIVAARKVALLLQKANKQLERLPSTKVSSTE